MYVSYVVLTTLGGVSLVFQLSPVPLCDLMLNLPTGIAFIAIVLAVESLIDTLADRLVCLE